MSVLRFVFDSPPRADGLPGLIEVEDENGRSVRAGEWREEPPHWVLYVPAPTREANTVDADLGCAGT